MLVENNLMSLYTLLPDCNGAFIYSNDAFIILLFYPVAALVGIFCSVLCLAL